MANNNLNIKASASLDRTKSLTQINADIKAIEGQLKHLKLQAGLDKGKSTAEIQRQITELGKKKRTLYVDLKLRQKELRRQYTNTVSQLQAQASQVNINANTTAAQSNINSLSNEVHRTTNETVTLASKLKDIFNNAGLVISSQTALQYIRKAASEATEAIKEYDKYATNLSIITGGSRSDSDKIIGDLAEKNLEFKVDISDLESAEETLLRTGKTIDETNKYLENTVYLSKLGFQDMDTSASQLVTIGNAYGYSADEMAAVVDKFTKLDTSANVTAGKLAEGVAKSAQNAKLAGFNIDQLSASIAGLKDTTGRSESEIANSLNMIFSRLQNVKLGKFVLETEDGTEDITQQINDTEKLLDTFGIKLRDSKNEFRDIGELFTELSEKWEDFNSVQQSAIATTIAGARQRNTFVGLITNWDRVQELTDISANSMGTAVQKYDSYLKSVEAKTAELKTSMTELWNNLLPGDFIVNITEAGTAVVQFTDKYKILQTVLKSALIFGVANGLISTLNGLKGMVTSLTNVSAAMNLASQNSAYMGNNLGALASTFRGLTDTQMRFVVQSNQMSQAVTMQILQLNGMSEAEARTKAETLALAQANSTAEISTFSLSGAFKSLWVTIAANPLMVLITLFGAVSTAIAAYEQKQEEARQEAVDAANSYEEQANALDELKQKYIDIVDSEGTETEKTEELNEWKQTLIESYGLEKEALENVNLEREKSLGLLDEEIKRQNRNDRGKWLGENKDAINTALNKINSPNYGSSTDGIIGTNIFNKINADEIRDSVKDLFENIYELGAEGNWQFQIGGDNLIEKYENLQKVIGALGNVKDLSDSERNLLDGLNKESAEIKKVLDENLEVYETYYKYLAENNFEDYVNENAVSDVGKIAYLGWKKGLLETADGDRQLEKELSEMAAQQFPDYEKYFVNRTKAIERWGGDSALSGFVNSLSDDDLDILVNKITDPFANGIEGAKRLIADFKNDPANQIEAETNEKSFEELKENYDNLSKSADTFVKGQKTVKSVLEEQAKHGQLSAESIKSLVDAGYSQALMYDETTGAVTLNTAELERLNDQKRTEIKLDLIKQKTDLAEKYSEEQKAISDLRLEYEALAKAGAAANQTRLSEIMLALAEHGATASEISGLINQYDGLINSLDAPTFDNDTKSSSSNDPWKDEFDKQYAQKKHDLEMNRISEEEFINWLDGAYKGYFSDLTKYQDEYNKYEEEVYKSHKDREQELFDLKMDNHKKLADNALDGKIDVDKFEKDMQAEYGLGNVDLTKRPKVKMEDGSTATVLSASEFVWQGDEETGKYVVVHYTPILPDGTILDDDTLNDYLYDTLENSENILDTDKNGLGIVLKVDTDFDISDEDVRSLETDKPTENIQNIIAACDEWDVALHEIQEDWVELTDVVSGDNIAARFDYARNEINAAIADTQARIDELSLIPGSEDEIDKLRDDLDGLYDVLEDIDDKERESEIDYIEKQKNNFTDTIDQHIDDIEREAEAVEKAYDKRIEAIDKQADAYDKQADSIDKEIEAIEKTNEAEKRKTDILEAQKKVKEAELELEKAHVKNRLVYVGNGRYEAKEDKDAVKEAEENLANAKADLEEKLQEEQVNILKDQKADIEAQKDILEDQKNVIEEAKDNADEYYSDIKDNLEQQKDTGEKTYDALIDILENADGKAVQNASNSNLYNRLAGTDDLKNAVDGLSPSEKQAAFDSGLLSIDSNGNYSLDYTAVDDNSQAVKDNTTATENLDGTLQKFMPGDSEGETAVDVSDKVTVEDNGSKVKPVTYDEWKKRHTLSEYAPKGKDIEDMTFEEYLNEKSDTKAEKRDKNNDKKSSHIIPLSEYDMTKVTDNGLKELFKAVNVASTGVFGAMGSMVRTGGIQLPDISELDIPVTTVAPQFNCTININGSADEKVVKLMKDEINNALNEYTTELKASLHRSLINQRYKP